MKKKIKKWHIVVLVILGVGGYWLSQNIWVFEKQIAVEDYEEFLKDSNWKNNEREINFYSDGTFKSYKFDYVEYGKKGSWLLNRDIMIIKSYTDLGNHTVNWNENWKINILTNNTLIYSVIGPGNNKIKLYKN